MKVEAIRTRVFLENEDLVKFICEHVKKLPENSLLVVTSKIVALSEGRVHDKIDEKTRERLIKKESEWAMKTKHPNCWLTIKDGMVMTSAGVDESNGNGKFILLPRDSQKSAESLRKTLMDKYKVKNLGVLITDSRLYPLRAGIVAVAMGYAGFCGVREYRGTKDIFGRVFRLERTDVADSLATAAVVVMGEGAEQQPLAVITDAPVEFTDKIDPNELKIDVRDDIYQPLFEHIKDIKWPRGPGASLKTRQIKKRSGQR